MNKTSSQKTWFQSAAGGGLRGWRTLLAGVVAVLGSATASMAQCEGVVTLTASKTEHLDAAGEVQRTEDEKSVIEISKTEFTRRDPENENGTFTAVVTERECEWKVPFKEGKTVLQVRLERDGETKDGKVTIEGKEGKVTLLLELDGRGIRVRADSFQAKK